MDTKEMGTTLEEHRADALGPLVHPTDLEQRRHFVRVRPVR